MGCDIHFVVEEQSEDGTWVGIFSSTGNYNWMPRSETWDNASPFWKFGDRDYRFFGALANVRCPGPDPLGLPKDLSSLAKLWTDNWGGDGHSHSYLPLRSFVHTWLASAPERLVAAACDNLEAAPDPIFTALNLNSKYDEDSALLNRCRVVFWFDN